ncbi:NTPase KAP family P-loop domain-containing protein 1-like isoform X2 [Carettochelys insculpta]|uniref:NTPase KAP family P-loop domain-containing protein 1-like isoform X2 n=1 Tax=Carettochelys insculpta TaxID=44489 RepID=UPI003EBF1F2D
MNAPGIMSVMVSHAKGSRPPPPALAVPQGFSNSEACSSDDHVSSGCQCRGLSPLAPAPVAEFQNKEDVYCLALAKALYSVPTPVTVGFYAPWGHCKTPLLQKIQQHMIAEWNKKAQREFMQPGNKQRGCSGWDLLILLIRMIFYHPVLTEQQKQRKNVEHLFIHFSAWEYAGCNQLWAGLITTLCDHIENHFGILPVSIYRALSRKCNIIKMPEDREWVNKKYFCLPLWAAVIFVIGVAIGLSVLLLVVGVPTGDVSGNVLAIVEGIGAATVGISTVAALRLIIMVVRNIVITQKSQLERQMNRTDLSAQLGFMSGVKREVRTITRFLQFMEIFQQRKLRVVLKITYLDRCSPDKVVGVLEAMNILLSDENAPFISILAVDPSIVVNCVESSMQMKGLAKNGYEFLNRIITLPFSVPQMDHDTKWRLVKDIIVCREQQERELEEEVGFCQDPRMEAPADFLSSVPGHSSANHEAKNPETDDSQIPLMVTHLGSQEPGIGRYRKSLSTKDHIQGAFDYLLTDSLKEYMPDSVVQIRRIVNTVTITIRLLASHVPEDRVRPKEVVDWVLLANQWPCRLSWVLQCIEDEEQRSHMGSCQASPLPPDTYLCTVYLKYMEELDMLKGHMEKLLELDQDPELFHNFLCHRFRVQEANFYLPFTVNLDPSLRKQMALQRGSHSLKWRRNLSKLTTCTLLGMTVEDVCREMDAVGFKGENLQLYKQRLTDHNLNGRALVYSNNTEIKEALGMNLGDWALFSIHFLGALPQPSSSTSAARPLPLNVGVDTISSSENVAKGNRLSWNTSREDLQEMRTWIPVQNWKQDLDFQPQCPSLSFQ